MPARAWRGTIAARHLGETQLAEVEALVAACRSHDGVEMALHLEPPRPGETNQFLHYEEGHPVGVASLPSPAPFEVMGMVHPRWRRRGLGRHLLEEARAECRRRGADSFFLVCTEQITAGKRFAEAMGGEYRLAEHLLQLDPAAYAPVDPGDGSLTLEPAAASDLDELLRLYRESFGVKAENAQERFAAWLAAPDQRFYIGRQAGRAVGLVRVATAGDEVVYLNTLGVLPALRRRGIGRYILAAASQELLAAAKTVRLEVETTNDSALSLYLACGFRPLATYHYYGFSTGTD